MSSVTTALRIHKAQSRDQWFRAVVPKLQQRDHLFDVDRNLAADSPTELDPSVKTLAEPDPTVEPAPDVYVEPLGRPQSARLPHAYRETPIPGVFTEIIAMEPRNFRKGA